MRDVKTLIEDELWPLVAERIRSDAGWSLTPVRRLGRPRAERWVWLAEGDPGRVIVKATANPSVGDRAEWAGRALSMLADRGYPVPGIRWHGMLDGHWSLVVQTELPGLPLRTLEPAVLDQLLALIELQADPRVESGGWDVSWWLGVVLFEGWEHWWEGTESAAPDTSRRLRAFLEPAWGHRLPVIDLVHGDLNLSNVLAADDAITGVVDWDALGEGSRTVDLAGLLFDWHRLRLARETKVAPDGHDRIVGRILDLAGDQGLRCAVTYGAIARVALTAQRGDAEGLVTWRAVTEAILDLIA